VVTRRSSSPDATRLDVPQPAHEQDDVLRLIQSATGPRDILVSTTGYTSRALYALGDRANQLYVVGSMGCASSVALGIALARPDHRVLLLDGDGAVLMRPSALACIGRESPANLLHVILDNGVHDSTGAQATLASNVDFCGLARACGYPAAMPIGGLEQLAEALVDSHGGLRLLHVRTRSAQPHETAPSAIDTGPNRPTTPAMDLRS
jgi:phosphonopyruvate decarboxylase